MEGRLEMIHGLPPVPFGRVRMIAASQQSTDGIVEYIIELRFSQYQMKLEQLDAETQCRTENQYQDPLSPGRTVFGKKACGQQSTRVKQCNIHQIGADQLPLPMEEGFPVGIQGDPYRRLRRDSAPAQRGQPYDHGAPQEQEQPCQDAKPASVSVSAAQFQKDGGGGKDPNDDHKRGHTVNKYQKFLKKCTHKHPFGVFCKFDPHVFECGFVRLAEGQDSLPLLL